jgi:hypothetical protein
MKNRERIVELLTAVRWTTNDIEKVADKILALFSVMQWVAVEDKLPKEMEWVLAYDAVGKQVRYMRRIDDLEWQMGRFSIRDVTHWMPIPKPPCA